MNFLSSVQNTVKESVCPTDELEFAQLSLALEQNVNRNESLNEEQKNLLLKNFRERYAKMYNKFANKQNPFKKEVIDSITSLKAVQAEAKKETFIGGLRVPSWWVIPFIVILYWLCCTDRKFPKLF